MESVLDSHLWLDVDSSVLRNGQVRTVVFNDIDIQGGFQEDPLFSQFLRT